MTKCIGCKKEFNHQGFPSHKKFCKAYKREIRVRLSNIPEVVAGPSISDEGILDREPGNPAGSDEMLMDDVQVSF
jgi:hypothetical protein